jgi:hypothetical protein
VKLKRERAPGLAAETSSIAARRLDGQRLLRHSCSSPAELVAWFGAVQAQDYGAAKWAVGLRLAPGTATEENVEQALSCGAVLRTHALRGTYHLVAAEDIRWLLNLVRPAVIAKNARRYRELGLQAATFRRSHALVAKALEEHGELTRHQLASVLEAGSVQAAGQRLPYLLEHAELDGLICSGPRRGGKASYALLDRRVPSGAKPRKRGESLQELARRYFESRGPATLEDFAWWSGLTTADAKAGLESVRSTLVPETVAGRTYWQAAATATDPLDAVHLLPAFDEYLIAYRHRDAVLDPARLAHVNAGGGMLAPCILVSGRVAGTWRRVSGRVTTKLELELFAEPSRRIRSSLELAAARYGAFLGVEVEQAFVT